MMDNEKMVNDLVTENKYGKMGQFTKVFGLMIWKMDKAKKYKSVVMFTSDNLLKEKHVGKDNQCI